jgi:capsular polysaccharide biosynthesis protein
MEKAQSYPAPGSSLGDIWSAVKRKWVTGVAVLAVTVVAAGILGALWPKSYQATAVIAVSPLAADPTRDIEVNIDTEAVIVTSRRVITGAADELGVDAKDLQDRTSVAIPTDSSALQVTVTADAADTAADQANAVADAYLDYRAKQAEVLVRNYVREGLDTQIESLLDGLAPDTSASEKSMVQRRVAALREKKSQILARTPGPGEVVSSATPPSSPSSPGVTMFIGAGLVIGALLGAAAALTHDRLDPRVRSARLLAGQVPCRVVDRSRRKPAQFREHVEFSLKAIRLEAAARADAPTVVVSSEGALRSDFLEELRKGASPETTGRVVVVPQPGPVGVAQAVASNPADAVFVIACRTADHLNEVGELVSSLEEWNRPPRLVLMLDAAVTSAKAAEKPVPAASTAAASKGSDGRPQAPQQALATTKASGPGNGAGNGAGNGTGNGTGNGNGNGAGNRAGNGNGAGNGFPTGQRPQNTRQGQPAPTVDRFKRGRR